MKNRIRLDTLTDVNKFQQIASKIDVPVHLTDGKNMRVSAKSMLGALYSMEWEEVWVECDKDIYFQIKDFLLNETPVDDDHEYWDK